MPWFFTCRAIRPSLPLLSRGGAYASGPGPSTRAGPAAPKERTRRHTSDGRRAATVPPRRTGRHGMRAGTDRVPGWTRRPAAARLALAAAAVEVGITLFVARAVEE